MISISNRSCDIYGITVADRFSKMMPDATLCDKVCQWVVAGRWYFPGTTVFSTNKTGRDDITEIWLKVALSTITHEPSPFKMMSYTY